MKNDIENRENLKRRKFLGVLGIGSAGIVAVKLISSTKKVKKDNSKLQVNIHPDAVQRTKKGKVS